MDQKFLFIYLSIAIAGVVALYFYLFMDSSSNPREKEGNREGGEHAQDNADAAADEQQED